MSRLIDADLLTEVLKSNGLKDYLVYIFIDQEPTVDAEIVRHGKWIRYPDCGTTVCSECGWSIEEAINYKRCPDCGAKMV